MADACYGVAFRRFLVGVLFFVPLAVYPAQKDRIQGPPEENRRVVLNGNRNRRAMAAYDRGAVDGSLSVSYVKLVVAQTAEQTAALEKLLEEQRDPGSPNYHNWLTPEEYGERFGLSEGDLGALASWLQSRGFAIEQVARARNWIAFSGTAAQIAGAFNTEIHTYEVDGETHFANASAPWIPAAFAGIVGELRGLDDFRPKPPRAMVRLNPSFNSANGMHYLAPDDLATIYDLAPLYQAGFNGTGQTLVIAGQTDINLSDIRGFRTQFNLAANDPQLVLYGKDPGVSPGDQIEADLDLEWSGAVARNAKIVYVYSQNVFESLQYAIDQNIAPVISLSYGACEAGNSASFRTVAQQANAQGITWMNASGDSGAAGCDWGVSSATHGPSVIFPADIPEVTAVGGSEFNEAGGSFWSGQNSASYGSALTYIPEKAWNDSALSGGIAASGGGASAVFAKPWWQTGPGVPADQARDVPDLALSASGDHDAYVIYASGGLMSVGGTSAASPAFAGIVALINQYVVAKGSQLKPGLGNINPNLYGMAQSTTGVFHDITAGDNIVPCTSGSPGCTGGSFGYKAGPGYDLVTGLGSVDANNLAARWAGQSALTGTATALAASPASIASGATTQLTATVTPVSGANPPTGSVAFMAGTTSLGSVALVASGSGGSASGVSATALLAVRGASLVSGNNTITANYTATGSFSSSSASAVVNVVTPAVATTTVVTASPANIAASATTLLTATVKAASGSAAPMGNVTFNLGSKTLGTTMLAVSGATATATLTVKGTSLAAGSNSITAGYAGNSAFNASTSAAIAVNVTAPLLPTTLSVAASSANIARSASTVLTATVKAATGTNGLSGSLTFTAGGATLGTIALSVSGATGTAALTVKGSSLAAGNNLITASYSGNGVFAGATGTVSVNVTSPAAATTTTVTASPSSISQSATTLLTATVKAASGAATPAGSVAFTLGTTSLGTVSLSSGGTAALTLKGSSLAVGSNTIAVSYSAAGNYSASTASVIVTVTPPSVNTTTAVGASPPAISQGSATVVTASVKAGGGSGVPTGTVTFTTGSTTLGAVSLTSSGMAALTIKGSSLATGSNVITAAYAGNAAFNGSTGSVTVNVTGAAASNVVVSVPPNSISQNSLGWTVTLQLQETAGVATSITGFTINGSNFTPAIASFFGSSQIAARGTLSSTMQIQWRPLPATIVFAFTGVDASGHQWSQSLSVPTTSAASSHLRKEEAPAPVAAAGVIVVR